MKWIFGQSGRRYLAMSGLDVVLGFSALIAVLAALIAFGLTFED